MRKTAKKKEDINKEHTRNIANGIALIEIPNFIALIAIDLIKKCNFNRILATVDSIEYSTNATTAISASYTIFFLRCSLLLLYRYPAIPLSSSFKSYYSSTIDSGPFRAEARKKKIVSPSLVQYFIFLNGVWKKDCTIMNSHSTTCRKRWK